MSLQLQAGAGFFRINDDTYPRGSYRVVIKEDLIGISETRGLPVVSPTLFSEWQDQTATPYATKQDLINDLRASIYLQT